MFYISFAKVSRQKLIKTQQNGEIRIQITMIAHYSGIISLLLISQTAAIFGIVIASPQVTTNAITIFNVVLPAFITVAVVVMNAVTLIQNYKWFGATLTLALFIGIPYIIARKNNKTHRDIETCINTIHNQNMIHNTYMSLDNFIRIIFSFIRAILLCFTQGVCDTNEPVSVIDKSWCNVDETNIISGKRQRITRNYSEECFEEREETEEMEEIEESEETDEPEEMEESEEEETEESEIDETEESEIVESEFSGEQIRRLRIYNKKNDDETEDEYLNRLVRIAEEENRQVVNNVLADVADKVGPQEIEVVNEGEIEVVDEEMDEILDEELDEELDEVLDQGVDEVLDQGVDEVLEEKDSDEDAYFRAKKDSLW
jgi:hypothetical protein